MNTLKTTSIYKDIDSMTARKPSCWSDIPAVAVAHELKSILFGRLPVLEIESEEYHPLDDIEGGCPAQRFMLNYGEKTYYVNNEGYNYCRYICEIV